MALPIAGDSVVKVRLVHDATQRTWATDASPDPGREPVELVGEGGKFTLYLERRDTGPHPFDVLTPRQRSVAERACRGLTTRAIAEDLGVGVETVRSHLKTLYARLGVAGRTELARVATGDLVLTDLA